VDSNSTGTAKQKEGSDKSHKPPLKTKESDKPKVVQMKLLDSFIAAPTGMPRAQSPSDKGQPVLSCLQLSEVNPWLQYMWDNTHYSTLFIQLSLS
jgi:hypothetical protein